MCLYPRILHSKISILWKNEKRLLWLLFSEARMHTHAKFYSLLVATVFFWYLISRVKDLTGCIFCLQLNKVRHTRVLLVNGLALARARARVQERRSSLFMDYHTMAVFIRDLSAHLRFWPSDNTSFSPAIHCFNYPHCYLFFRVFIYSFGPIWKMIMLSDRSCFA